jgi:hypothetical protein
MLMVEITIFLLISLIHFLLMKYKAIQIKDTIKTRMRGRRALKNILKNAFDGNGPLIS